MNKTYVMPAMATEAAKEDRGAAMAFFLLENTGSVLGKFIGPIKATDQRTLFGRYFGKGWVHLNGDDETVRHSTTVCFGTMRDFNTRTYEWRELL